MIFLLILPKMKMNLIWCLLVGAVLIGLFIWAYSATNNTNNQLIDALEVKSNIAKHESRDDEIISRLEKIEKIVRTHAETTGMYEDPSG